MTTHIEVLKNSTLKDNVLTLPAQQLNRKLYQDTAKALEGIGGKWNKKALGFVFPNDPTELLEEIKTGVKRNIKQETQFFETPKEVALFMVHNLYNEPHHTLLEPSAGRGALLDAFIEEGYKGSEMFWIEKHIDNNRFLQNKYKDQPNMYHIHPLNDDFLQIGENDKFDRILANPPFTKNQDIDHVYKMWECLKPKGRIVTITSKHWTFASGKKEQAFKQWVEDHDVLIYDLEGGTFKKSGTMVASQILVIDKP